ncbi:MAG: penicillin amidase [Bradymonadia bacterium]|jgi:penicillin amidase
MRWIWAAAALAVAGCDDDGVKGGPGDMQAGDMASAGGAGGGGAGGEGGAGGSGGEADDGGLGGEGGGAPMTPAERIEAVPETERWQLAGLTAPVQVVRTEMNVPHIYAQNRADLGRTLGFVVSRDRYFVIDLQRRLGLGTLSALLGDLALANDIESRMTGIPFVADRLLENLSPELTEYLQAFAEGINSYIAAVAAGEVPPPSELRVAAPLLGAATPAELMVDWTLRDVAGMVAVVMYQTTFESGDVGRSGRTARLESLFVNGEFEAELRRDGFLDDLWENVTPHLSSPSAAGLGLETADGLTAGPLPGARGLGLRPEARTVPTNLIERLTTRLAAQQLRFGRDKAKGFGSNAWAVAGTHSTDGRALVAGDGHLQLSVPALMYQIGLDTQVFGGGDVHQAGLLLTGLPVMAIGTNGRVAYSQVNPVFDITDWYREEIELGDDGAPTASRFQGESRPLIAVDEEYVVANVPAFDSVGRTETWTRWTTFDGRWLVDIEGRALAEDEQPAAGETVVNMQGTLIVPADTNDDGVITAISFDYAAFDATNYVDTLDNLGFADSVEEYREATRGLVGSALFSAVADHKGDVLFTSYQAVPCRGYLDRAEDGSWLPGANPMELLDGTQYGGFTLPMANGRIDPAPGLTDPYQCAVPFESVPQALSPARGYVHTANNDPGGLTLDGRLDDDDWYIGGPWAPTRAHTIARDLEESIAANSVDIAAMSATQGNIDSRMGELFAPYLLQALTAARAASEIDGGEPHMQRLAALYAADADAFSEAQDRLEAWVARDVPAESGVETVYHQPTDAQREDSIATMIFNAWLGRFMRSVYDDEALPWRYSASRMQVRSLIDYLSNRGPENVLAHTAWNPATGEAIFFDRLGTDDIERADELMLQTLSEALDFLRSEPTEDGEGGFGTDDMTAWLWGLRHQVRFESLLAGFLGDDSSLSAILNMFSITTRQLPLTAERLPREDPRAGLKWFPRPGDQWSVDAANPGFSGSRFTHGNGPVMRMVIALDDGAVEGVNIVPGGQSGLTDSPHFKDQAALWLANETVPLRFSPAQVTEGATGREVYTP